jgi:hypothetical protein
MAADSYTLTPLLSQYQELDALGSQQRANLNNRDPDVAVQSAASSGVGI